MKNQGISTIAVMIIIIVVAVAVGGLFFLTPQAPGVEPSSGGENLPGGGQAPSTEINVIFTGSAYQSVTQKPTGWFTTGQNADIVLGLTDFDEAEPTLFNHPMKVATDGTRIILADTWNNRVLIWNSIPTGNNRPPDLVVGQDNLYSNTPGLAPDKLNWPVGVATDGQRLIVADTVNNRVLIWNEFPTQDGEPADLVLGAPDFTTKPTTTLLQGTGSKERIVWSWDVFTDGTVLIVVSTGAARVSIWNQFPTQNNQPADVVLTSAVGLQTPRSALFDGQHLLVGDYNAKKTFIWNQLPQSDDTPYDYILWEDPTSPMPHAWSFSRIDNKLIAAVDWYVSIWNEFPTSASNQPDITIRTVNVSHGGIAATENYLITSEFNPNRVTIFNGIPTSSYDEPDVVLGAQDFETNTLLENYNVIQNAAVYSDGKHLFIGSDFDRRLFIWKNLPDQSVAIPDIVYEGLPSEGVVVYDNKLVVSGGSTVYIWNRIPLAGENADILLGPDLGGGMQLSESWGITADANYLFVSDKLQNKIFVWEGGIPNTVRAPDFAIDVNQPYKLSSDGQHLAAASLERGVLIWNLPLNMENLTPNIELLNSQVGFNLPMGVFIDGQHLFVADTSNHRVLIWNSIPTSGSVSPDVVLGQQNLTDTYSQTTRDGLYRPGSVYFDGSYLWVGEFKFSNRALRYSVH